MEEEKTLLQATLCYLIKGDKVLLSLKTKRIGKDCWNGYGGGIDEGESQKQAALRELEEESGIMVLLEHLDKAAIIDFQNTKSDGSVFTCQVHVYLVSQWIGKPRETDEMINPTWFNIKHLPTSEMMPADREWLPLVLSGKRIRATANYGPFQKKLRGKVEIQ